MHWIMDVDVSIYFISIFYLLMICNICIDHMQIDTSMVEQDDQSIINLLGSKKHKAIGDVE